MRADAIVFGIAGSLFGLIIGWVLGSQQVAGTVRAAVAAPAAQSAPASDQQASAAQPQAAPVDPARVKALQDAAAQNPKDVQPRVQLGNIFFDAEQYPQAITWYEQALALNPNDTNVSTDLGVAYYYTNQPDKALAQFDKSLAQDPKHVKTLLNVGIVRAFGKQDLAGAGKAWQQVVDISPNSPEGQAAKKGLEGIKSAHPESRSGGK
jgi:cytochrome c-type biogenesis protein CcmH/NrfG